MEENKILRRLLWQNHGCPVNALYGDDGEMQCHACVIDFLRMPAERIEQVFFEKSQPTTAKFLKAWKKVKNKGEIKCHGIG